MQATATSPEVSPAQLADELFALIVYLQKSSGQDVFRALADHEISLTQLKMMHVLDGADGELSLKELAGHLSLSEAAGSRAVDALHQRKLVDRREDEEDRRVKRVCLTGKGRDTINRINEARVSAIEQFVSTLSGVERRRLLSAVEPLVAREDVAACRRGRKRR